MAHQLQENGVPVTTLVSGLAANGNIRHVGIDNRAAGRTAAYLIGRFIAGTGKVAVLWSGSLSRAHEEREVRVPCPAQDRLSRHGGCRHRYRATRTGRNREHVAARFGKGPVLGLLLCGSRTRSVGAGKVTQRRSRRLNHHRAQPDRHDEGFSDLKIRRCDHSSGHAGYRQGGRSTGLPIPTEDLRLPCPRRCHPGELRRSCSSTALPVWEINAAF